MFGLTHSATVFLTEQLFGAQSCRNYSFKYHAYERDEYDEVRTTHGYDEVRTCTISTSKMREVGNAMTKCITCVHACTCMYSIVFICFPLS